MIKLKATKTNILETVARRVDADSAKQKIESQKNIEISAIHEKYEKDLLEYEAEMEACDTAIREYVEKNRDTLLEGDKKSTKLGVLTVGWRSNPKKLGPLENTTVKDIIENMKKKNPGYIVAKTTWSLDDKKILKEVEEGKLKRLDSFGLQIVQDEIFFIK